MNTELNPFGNITTDGLEQQGDFLGGGGLYESGTYTGEIVLAYAGATDSGSRFFEVHIKTDANKTYRERLWVVGKNGQNYYERDNKKIPLVGYTIANDICLLATGKDLATGQTFEEKVVKLYDFNERKELPTKVSACTSVMGKQITIGVVKRTVNKQKKDASGTQYVNYTNDDGTVATRDENTIDKVFHGETGKTVSEYMAKQEKAEFKEKWEAKNNGVTQNRVKPVEGSTGIPGMGASGSAPEKPSSGLFG